MATIYDVDPQELIEAIAVELKSVEGIDPPEWSKYTKTGSHKERPPVNRDWWYVRSASVLRKVYKLGPIGVSKLRREYGGKKNRGMAPGHHMDGSGSIARKVLQQLEKAGLVAKKEKSKHKGRVITTKGRSLLDKTSTKLLSGLAKKPRKEDKEKPAEKTQPQEKKQAGQKQENTDQAKLKNQ